MSKTLGGFIFVTSGNTYDYSFKESIGSLCEVCDKVNVLCLDLEQDGTHHDICKLMDVYPNMELYDIDYKLWEDTKGKTKLAHFQNIAAMALNTDYQILVQADEAIHPDSYSSIRQAMETGAEGFLCERVNLWGTPNHMLTVPLDRQPCSLSVVRLTKRGYWCYDDGENIGVPHPSTAYYDKIKIIHYGFVRKKEVMKAKIINMQEGVFAMSSHDQKLDQCDVFDSTLWFDGYDLTPINFTHPPIMNKWVMDRMY